jgi:hypothetical protein
MSTFLKIVRYIFAILLIIILSIVLFIGLPLTATTQTIIKKENVKEIVNNPIIYENLVDTFVESLSTQDQEDLDEILILLEDNSEFKQNLERVVTSPQTQQKVNTFIDSFYDWFDGKSNFPQLEIYLIEDEEVFKEMLTSILLLRVENLPTCDTYSYEDFNTDPLSMECIPPFIDSDEIEPLIVESLEQEDITELMESFKISSTQFNISYNDTVLIQNIYTLAQFLPIILIVLVIFLTLLIVLLIPGFKGGLITTSIIYILNSILYLLITLLNNTTQTLTTLINSTDISTYEGYREIIMALTTPIMDHTMNSLKLYSLITLGVGILLLIVGILVKKKDKQIEKNINTQTETK